MLRKWLLRPVLNKLNNLGSFIMSALSDIVTKIVSDIDAKLETLNGQLTAKDAQIANLTTQLADAVAKLDAQAADLVDVDASIAALTTADAKLNP